MGTIYYGGSATPIHIEDRALAHLKMVITTKLRRGESFTVSWQHPEDHPQGRSTIWLHPSIPLRFVFDDPKPPELSSQWVQELAASANSSGGIALTAEHIDTEPARVTSPEGVDMSFGHVDIDRVDVTKLTVAGNDMSAREPNPQ